MRGFMYKRAEKKLLQTKMFYKRFFVVQEKCSFIQVQEQQVTKNFKRIFLDDIDCI